MNQRATTMFKGLLTQTGLSKKFKKYSEGIDNNTERYYDNVEAIYVLSRIYPYILDIKDKERFVNANKLWMGIVIANDFCNELTPYIKEYGKQMVLDAIHNLIDSDRWQSPKMNSALKSKQPNNYDGLKDIYVEVDYIQEQIGKNEPQSASVKEPVIVVEQSPQEEEVGGIVELADSAHKSIAKLQQMFVDAKSELENLEKYSDVEMEALLMEEVDKLQVMLRKSDNDKEVLSERVVTLERKYADLERYRSADQEATRRAKKELSQVAKEKDELMIKYRNVVAELDKYKQQQREDTLPKKKIIPYSAFSNIPHIGGGTIQLLQPVLEKYGIILDPKK